MKELQAQSMCPDTWTHLETPTLVCDSCHPPRCHVTQKKLEAHGEMFIPFRVAKGKVSEVQNDMLTLRDKHMNIIKQVEGHYRDIAREQEEYYLAYIQNLNKAAQARDAQQCALLSTIRTEADSYRCIAVAQCQKLEEEITAQQQEIHERDEYIQTQRRAMTEMQQEAERQQFQDLATAEALRANVEHDLQQQRADLLALSSEAADLFALLEATGKTTQKSAHY